MIQCQKKSVDLLGINVPIMHSVFALLVRHSEWLMNHLVRSDFQVEADERVVKTSPYESHTGNPAPRATKLLSRILVGGRDANDKQPRLPHALHPDGTQRHHGEWRESPLDDPEAKIWELQLALFQED